MSPDCGWRSEDLQETTRQAQGEHVNSSETLVCQTRQIWSAVIQSWQLVLNVSLCSRGEHRKELLNWDNNRLINWWWKWLWAAAVAFSLWGYWTDRIKLCSAVNWLCNQIYSVVLIDSSNCRFNHRSASAWDVKTDKSGCIYHILVIWSSNFLINKLMMLSDSLFCSDRGWRCSVQSYIRWRTNSKASHWSSCSWIKISIFTWKKNINQK